MKENKIVSCISICKTDPVSSFVMDVQEQKMKKIWKDENTDNDWKSKNLRYYVRMGDGNFQHLKVLQS